MANETNKTIVRATGLLVIEAINSNPNGDPDRESDPRQRPDGRGEISPVSFKRKVRDLIDNKDGEVWKHLKNTLELNPEKHDILESRDRGFKGVESPQKAWSKVLELIDGDASKAKDKYWDARVFGATFLEKGEEAPSGARAQKDRKFIRTGVAHFGLGVSLAPISIRRFTMTKMASAQEEKDRGMAPLAFRVVEHGVYTIPFFVNPNAAAKSGCTAEDIQVLLKTIPHAYAFTRSVPRTMVEIRHAWYMEHKSSLGSCSDFALISALTPKRKVEFDPEKPSKCSDEYDVPTALPDELVNKVKPLIDLVTEE